MSDVIDALRTLYRTTGHPPRILIRGETTPRSVTGVREIGGGAVLSLAGGREIMVRARDVWAGVYVASSVVQVDATDERGDAVKIRLLDTELVAHGVSGACASGRRH